MAHDASSTPPDLEAQVARAREGERAALESVVRAVQQEVYALALRFLWHPEVAEDATQEILIRVITGIGGFRGESGFRTWVYRIASNTLLGLKQKRMERQALSFEAFGEDLAHGLSDALQVEDDPDRELLLQEVRVGCTLAMLLCLDREHRLAYILGEIVGFGHREGARILAISPAAFRKRLSRARSRINAFMAARCGLVDPGNACRCHRRVETAVALGRVDPRNLRFAAPAPASRPFTQVVAHIRELESTRRAAALYNAHPQPKPVAEFMAWLTKVLDAAPAPETLGGTR